jgi:hypothetical protein
VQGEAGEELLEEVRVLESGKAGMDKKMAAAEALVKQVRTFSFLICQQSILFPSRHR